MDWRDENWDKIWICGIFWGFWIRGFGGKRGLGDFGGICWGEGGDCGNIKEFIGEVGSWLD